MKILLVNFGAFGDILNSTPIAKNYKLMNPSNNITWMTTERYTSAIKNNPYIDNIITLKEYLSSNLYPFYVNMTFDLKDQIVKLNYDKIYFIAPYTWTINNPEFDLNKHSLLEIIKTKLTDIEDFICDFIPVVKLSEQEKLEAKTFFDTLNGDKKILIEFENFSNQSPFDERYIEKLCELVNDKNYDLVLSGRKEPEFFKTFKLKYNVNFHTYSGSFMSNAELYNLCDSFIGCSSGISCLTHSDYCDNNKSRIEVSKGLHWSTNGWTHMKNKKICYNFEQYTDNLMVIK